MNINTVETPWVTLKKGDPSFKLQGPLTIADRASLEIDGACPQKIVEYIRLASERGWIRLVATVPKNDPTLVWDTIKN